MTIKKEQLIFDPTDPDSSDNVGAFIRSDDGTLITHTETAGKKALDTNIVTPELSLRFDQVSTSLMYLAEGIFGALDSDANWKIKKIEITGTSVSIKNASEQFDQVWNNRTSLTYV